MTENNDIKPVRPEIASKRGALRNKGGGVLFSSTITIINSLGLVLLFFWFFNTSGNQQEAGQNFIERISSLEESSTENQKVIDELSQNIDAEQALLGSVLVNNDILDEVANIINFKEFLNKIKFIKATSSTFYN